MHTDEAKRAAREALFKFLASDNRAQPIGLPPQISLPTIESPWNGNWYYVGNCESCNQPVPLIEEPFPHKPAASFGEVGTIVIVCSNCEHEQQHSVEHIKRVVWQLPST